MLSAHHMRSSGDCPRVGVGKDLGLDKTASWLQLCPQPLTLRRCKTLTEAQVPQKDTMPLSRGANAGARDCATVTVAGRPNDRRTWPMCYHTVHPHLPKGLEKWLVQILPTICRLSSSSSTMSGFFCPACCSFLESGLGLATKNLGAPFCGSRRWAWTRVC